MSGDRAQFVLVVGLLIGLAAFAAGRVVLRELEENDPEIVVIRIGHNELGTGVREALDAVAAQYQRLHPHVRIRQTPVPLRAYNVWATTQLVGRTAPDILEIEGREQGFKSDLLVRYFLPLASVTEHPNPYNRGTPLEHLSWRATFVDGLSQPPAYSPALTDTFGVNLTMETVRLFVNERLLREIIGEEPFPTTYEGFLALCERIHQFAHRSGRSLVPIAGSRGTAPLMLDRLFAHQTQNLTRLGDHRRLLNSPAPIDVALDLLAGRRNLREEPIQLGLQAMRETGRHLQRGFAQLQPEDAAFYFLQQRAVMVAGSTGDFRGYTAQATFPLLIVDFPLPDRDHPIYGRNFLGRPAEASGTRVTLGVVNFSRHQEVALDFLRFLTSQAMSEKFTALSGWLPSIAGVPAPAGMEPFMPQATPQPYAGFTLRFPDLPDAAMLINASGHLLYGEDGSVEKYTSALEAALPEALRTDIRRRVRFARESFIFSDLSIATFFALATLDPEDSRHLERLLGSLDNQSRVEETSGAWIQELAQMPGR
jgi:raffinose/stachyose/melibiose transport system substrate-binding protein